MKKIIVPSEKKELNNVLNFINENLDSINPSFKFRMQLELSIEEIFMNIIDYAYSKSDDKNIIAIRYDIEYDIGKNPSKVIIEISDWGIPFNPLENEEPDLTLSSDEREIGGLGIFLLKKNVDYVDYEYKNRKNILTIKKNIL